jgi:hypothetical protein
LDPLASSRQWSVGAQNGPEPTFEQGAQRSASFGAGKQWNTEAAPKLDARSQASPASASQPAFVTGLHVDVARHDSSHADAAQATRASQAAFAPAAHAAAAAAPAAHPSHASSP